MQTILFKRLNSVVLILLLMSNTVLQAQNRPELLSINDAQQEARLSEKQQLPILIMFGTESCPFCHLLKDDFLIPMIISGDYTDKVILRQVYVEEGADIISFSGTKIRCPTVPDYRPG